ncbi:branched chain amino acid aminotransferase [Chitinophagaceae bacterium IBVUCB2]|nr:branched chain amino acid aminotransferase [Chitinophagaceae bacterium IBVUCB2]
MELLTDIPVKRVHRSAVPEVDFSNLEFGKYTSDHMLLCDYSEGEWHQPMILPFENLSLSPSTLALHYGQTVFEGMKAFRMDDGRINIFRIDKHYDRFVKSLDRLCMAAPPKDFFTEGLIKLVDTDKTWVPRQKGAALYLRPFVYASEARFGVKISEQYRFLIFSGPVPELYANPIKVKVETNYIRAAKGGTGFAKCGGNYGGAYYPTKLAREQGYEQVLWTDAKENKFIEESGMMNVMFVINNVLVTPPLSDSILDGVTRDSILTLANDMGYKTEERPVAVEELVTAFRNKTITEAFGAGTAAVVAPIETININGIDYQLPGYGKESLLNKLKTKLENIRTGIETDVHEWNFIV